MIDTGKQLLSEVSRTEQLDSSLLGHLSTRERQGGVGGDRATSPPTVGYELDDDIPARLQVIMMIIMIIRMIIVTIIVIIINDNNNR